MNPSSDLFKANFHSESIQNVFRIFFSQNFHLTALKVFNTLEIIKFY